MKNFNWYQKKSFLLGLLLVITLITCFSAQMVYGSESENKGDLKIYEKKSFFIFPILYNNSINSSILSEGKKEFLAFQMFNMFVRDFKRIDFFNVKADDSIDTFIEDTHSYLLKNVKNITVRRMDIDGKFKEAMVTDEELLKTTENSYALVPYIDSVEREVIQGKDSIDYSYNLYIHFDVYNTKTKEKIKTLQINNKRNLLGILSSFSGSLLIDNSDLEGLPEDVKKDEISFRNAISGLFTVMKKKLKEMPEFCIMTELSMVNRSKFGFNIGEDTGIKIDHRYKTFVSRSDGGEKKTGFGKIRKVTGSYSEAQILIGKPQEGDQVMEEPKVGINVVGGFGTAPLHISMSSDIVSGSHKCLFLGVEYELGPTLRLSEWYTTFNLRFGSPSLMSVYSNYTDVSQILINLGVVKKIYFRRLALNFGGFIGVNGATLTHEYYGEIEGRSFGFTMNTGLEFMINPSISAFGCLNLDVYPNPSKLNEDGANDDFPDGWKWNAKGLSLNFGVKVTL